MTTIIYLTTKQTKELLPLFKSSGKRQYRKIPVTVKGEIDGNKSKVLTFAEEGQRADQQSLIGLHCYQDGNKMRMALVVVQ